MITNDQPINRSTLTEITRVPCYRRKGYRMTVLFVAWLAYSAYTLSWNILNTQAALHCTNHVN